jgi:hypothetical protein
MAPIKIKGVKKKSPFKRIRPGQHDIHAPEIRPPKKLRSTPKSNVKQLLNLVDQKKRVAAKEIAIKAMRTMDLPANQKLVPPETVTYRIQTYSKHNRHIHNVTVFAVEGLPFTSESKVMIDCSCSSHIFHSEYHMARRGNAFLWRSNGDAPTTNLTPTICKHTYMALRYMLRRAKNETLPKKSLVRKKLSFNRGT